MVFEVLSAIPIDDNHIGQRLHHIRSTQVKRKNCDLVFNADLLADKMERQQALMRLDVLTTSFLANSMINSLDTFILVKKSTLRNGCKLISLFNNKFSTPANSARPSTSNEILWLRNTKTTSRRVNCINSNNLEDFNLLLEMH